MTFQPDPHEPEGPRSPEEEAAVRRQALRIGAELDSRGFGWVVGPAAARLAGDPHALYHVRDATGTTYAFATLDDIDTWLADQSAHT